MLPALYDLGEARAAGDDALFFCKYDLGEAGCCGAFLRRRAHGLDLAQHFPPHYFRELGRSSSTLHPVHYLSVLELLPVTKK